MKKKFYLLFCFVLFLLITKVEAVTISSVDVTKMGIQDLLRAMDEGYLDSETLVNIYLERIEKYDEMFNSINQINKNAIEEAKKLDEERKSGNLRGRLHGIPILVKCNIDVVGIPTTAGTKSLLDNYPKENAIVVQRLLDEGAIILGSTNMSELAFSAATSYSSYGYVRNVFNTDFTSYGSSGGSAVAVKAGFAVAALGTDTNSSVRLPASGAGLVGIRPSYGLVSKGGVIPYDYERDTVGVISHNVYDSALILNIISGSDSRDTTTLNRDKVEVSLENTSLKGVNIGVATQYTLGKEGLDGVLGLTDPEIYTLVEKSISVLEKQGANIIYLDNFVKSSNLTIATSTYAGYTMCDYFDEYIKGTNGKIRTFEELANSSGHVQRLSGYAESCGGTANEEKSKNRWNKKETYRNYVNKYMDDNDLDVIIYPTLKNKVFKYNGAGNISPGSSLGSVIGFPSITIPMGYDSDGFSYGIEILSRAFDENTLYNVAYEYEKGNGNTVSTSPLTPSLYEVPDSVIELKELYDKVRNANSSIGKVKEWGRKVETFFKDYATLEDIDKSARNLIDECKTMKIIDSLEKEETFSGFFKYVMYFMIALAVLFIIKNIIKCFD